MGMFLEAFGSIGFGHTRIAEPDQTPTMASARMCSIASASMAVLPVGS